MSVIGATGAKYFRAYLQRLIPNMIGEVQNSPF